MGEVGYQYKVREVEERAIIAIKADSDDIVTVMDDVLDHISKEEGLNPIEHYVIFSGPHNVWNGYNIATKTFVPLNVRTGWKDAATEMIKQP